MTTQGQASVQIVADLSRFASRLSRELNRILQNVQVDARPVAEKIVRSIERHLAGARLNAARMRIDPTGTQIDAREIVRQVGRQIQRALGTLNVSGSRITFTRVRIDTRGIIRQIERALSGQRITASRLVIDLARVRVDTRHIVNQIRSALRGLSFAGIGRGLTIGRDIGAVVSAAASTAASAASSIAELTAKIGGLTIAIGAALGVIADLAQVLNVAFLVPAGLAALVTVIGVVKLATLGLSEAWEASGEALSGSAGDVQAYREALAKLAPAARDLIMVLRGWKPVLDELARAVQQSVFVGIASQIHDLSVIYFPILRQGLLKVGAAINKTLHSLAEFLKTPAAIEAVKHIIDATAEATEFLGQALKSVVAALFSIADVGSEFLPGIAKSAANAAKRFEEWAFHARETGQMREWLKTALSILKDMIGVSVNVARSFLAISRAASDEKLGQGILKQLKDWSGKLADYLNSPAGQKKLREFFADVKDALKDIKKFFEDLADPNSQLRKDLKDTLIVLKDIRDVFVEIDGWAHRISGRIDAIKTAVLGAWAALSTPITVGDEVSTFVDGAISTISALPVRVAAALSTLPAVVSGVFAGAWRAAVTGAAQIVNDTAATASTLPGRAAAALSGLRATVGGVLAQAWVSAVAATADGRARVVAQIAELRGQIVSVFASAGSWLVGAGRSLMQGLLNGIVEKIGALRGKLGDITISIPDWKGPLTRDLVLLRPAGEAIMSGLIAGIDAQLPALRAQLSAITADIGGPRVGRPIAADVGPLPSTSALNGPPGAHAESRAAAASALSGPIVIDNHIHIGDEVVRVVRSEIDESIRDTRRRVLAGAGSR